LPTAIRMEPRSGALNVARQFLQQLRFDVKGVFRSVPFLVMLAFAMINFIGAALNQGDMYGTPLLPVSSQMLASLQGSFSWMLIIIVLFHAGELVWKERAVRIHEVTDAMPLPDWLPLSAKFCTLVLVVASFQATGALVAMAIQGFKGTVAIEPAVYLKTLSVDSLIYVLMGGAALCLQVLSNNKFAGYALLILVLVVQATLGMLDYTHHLYTFGSWPIAPYSDMNGYGHFLRGQLAFEGYWLLFMAVLLLVSVAMWVRGSESSWGRRLSRARERMRGRLAWATALAAVAFVAWGGVLFWNTNVRNTFIAPDRQLDLQARYETALGGFRKLPQPRILAASTEIDLRPETQALHVRGRYRIVNPHDAPIEEIHVAMAEDETLASIDLGGASLARHEQALGYRIYRLDTPMQPGETRDVDFVVDRVPRGITNDVAQHEVVENGSFFNNRLFPAFGYQAGAEIMDRNERRKRGLGEARRMNPLEDEAARANNYVDDDADWIDFKTTICTAPDQTALAPGYLTRRFERDGRACFSYEMDRPMLNYYAFLSGRWEVAKGRYKDIPIEVYHHPGHAFNVQRMIEAARKSLAYYEEAFTPYQHRQLRILEFPGYETFAQSFANTIPYSERIGFIADLGDPEAIDYVFYVTAHEVAHQWWAHQVIGADVQGATVLSESLSQYSALMVMEREYGREKMRRFLRHELDSYLSDRGGERLEELPLYRVENQPYIHYRKGALVFYRLREEIGEAALNRALKRFLQDKGYQSPPYTTSAELVDYIRAEAPAAAGPLITDLFEKISFYDNRVEAAQARRREDGKYEVTLSLHAAKRYADGIGKETAGTLDDWIEVGVFGEGEEGEETVLYLERLHVTRGDPAVTVVVDALPVEAGFDPYNKLIDRVSSDNRKRISL
ncbi:M1 family aminopeptidase, partial [Marilutibacter aestuarii]